MTISTISAKKSWKAGNDDDDNNNNKNTGTRDEDSLFKNLFSPTFAYLIRVKYIFFMKVFFLMYSKLIWLGLTQQWCATYLAAVRWKRLKAAKIWHYTRNGIRLVILSKLASGQIHSFINSLKFFLSTASWLALYISWLDLHRNDRLITVFKADF